MTEIFKERVVRNHLDNKPMFGNLVPSEAVTTGN
jgi:hypothetical protein